jgi:hypothetical protein
MTTIGYGDISAGGTTEMVYAMFCMLLGAGVFAYGITTMCNILANLNLREVAFRSKMVHGLLHVLFYMYHLRARTSSRVSCHSRQ